MIAILGAGIAGTSLAWALTSEGYGDVEVYDPNGFASGSTTRATGGFRTQFASELNVGLSLASRPFFTEHARQIDFLSCGYALVAVRTDDRHSLDQWMRIQSGLGLPVERRSATECFPFINFGAEAECNFCPLDGVFDPSKLLVLFRSMAEAGGARFHFGRSFTDIDRVEAVVIAAGAWSPEVAAAFGIDIAIQAEKRRVWLLDGLPMPSTMPLGVDLDGGWVFRQRAGRFLLASPALTGDQDPLVDWARRRLPAEIAPRVADSWEGLYEVTPDRHPYVGRTKDPKIWLSCGFSGHGIMHSPAVAQALADQLVGASSTLDISALSPRGPRPPHEPTNL